MALYSAVLSITGKLYILFNVSCIQERALIYFRHKSRDDPHPFARSTRSAQAATIHFQGSFYNGIVGMIHCLNKTSANIQRDSNNIPWGNMVTLTNRSALCSISHIFFIIYCSGFYFNFISHFEFRSLIMYYYYILRL